MCLQAQVMRKSNAPVFGAKRAWVGGVHADANGGHRHPQSESKSELQGADPIRYACVKRSKQSKKTCKGSA
eukprot:365333-Chlamydomonas_euryale.AAC.13